MFGFKSRPGVTLCAVLVGSQLIGCGGSPYQLAPVHGRVTCQGKPAAGGVIEFRPLDAPEKTGLPKGNPGTSSRGTIAADGTFTLTVVVGKGEGAVIGPHRVVFQMPPTKRPTLRADEREIMSPEEIKKLEEEFSRRPVYPPLPCGANLLPGEVEVKAGNNEFEFRLQAK